MEHQPVLLKKVMQALAVRPEGRYLDATFGRGGHAAQILQQLSPQGRLIALDKDQQAVAYGQARWRNDPCFSIYHQSFAHLVDRADQPFDGILFDLGVSSPQLDQAERGFSFQKDGPLDMRMDQSRSPSAAQWLNQADESEISTVLFRYGQERYARRIARAIVRSRPFYRTLELSNLIERTVPKKERHKHPATRSFQAIRIHINRELDELEQALHQAVQLLAPGGRLVVISFHSLEDRIVKRLIKQYSQNIWPKGLPIRQNEMQNDIILKPLFKTKPDMTEIKNNPRARSAILRVAEKCAG